MASNMTIWLDTHYYPGASKIAQYNKIGSKKAEFILSNLTMEENNMMSHVKASHLHLFEILSTKVPADTNLTVHIMNRVVVSQLNRDLGAESGIFELIERINHIVEQKNLHVTFINTRGDNNLAHKYYKKETYKPPRPKRKKKPVEKKEDKFAWVRNL